jgi:hypothetical protein
MTRPALILVVSLLALGCRGRPSPPDEKARPREETWRAFYVVPSDIAPRKDKPRNFDQVRSGMTLGGSVATLGPGRIAGGPYHSGCGIIRWTSEDGRQLEVWPTTYCREEVIDAGPRQLGGAGGRGRMWMTRLGHALQDLPIPPK